MAEEMAELFGMMAPSPAAPVEEPAAPAPAPPPAAEAPEEPAEPVLEAPAPAPAPLEPEPAPVAEAASEQAPEATGLAVTTTQDMLKPVQQAGLQAAPEYGEGMYVASLQQLQSFTEITLQDFKAKYSAKMTAMQRYIDDLENNLSDTEENLLKYKALYQEEQVERKSVEAERDVLHEEREAQEAKVVDSVEAEAIEEDKMAELERKVEEVAEQVARGEISEEEGALAEDELIRQQAIYNEAKQKRVEENERLQEVVDAETVASDRVEDASLSEEQLRGELEAMEAKVNRLQAERDQEQKRAEESEDRFQKLVDKIQAKVNAGGGR